MPSQYLKPRRLRPRALLICAFTVLLSLPALGQSLFYPKAEQRNNVLHISASVEAQQHARLASQQAGLLAELYVEVGDEVKAGTALLKLDDQLAQLELQEAEASLNEAKVAQQEAKRLYSELKALAAKKFVAATLINERRAQVAQSEAGLNKQQAALAIKQEQLRRHTLTAPFDGIIAERQAQIGEWLSPQSMVLSLVQHQALRLKLAIPQEYFAKVDVGDAVTVSSKHNPQANFEARIDRLVAVSNPQSRTFTAYVDIANPEGLAAGMSATVGIKLGAEQTERLWFPNSAIKQHPDGGASVFAVVNGKAKRYIVKVLEAQAQQSAISGAPATSAYIKSGVELLRDGDTVDSQENN